MDDSWKPLADEARNNWQHAWRERSRGNLAVGGGNPQGPFRDALNNLPSMVRDQCRELDEEVGKWLKQLSDLKALSDANGTSEELIGKIRDGAKNSVEELRQNWAMRGLDDSGQLRALAGITHTRIDDLTRAAAAKTAVRIRLRESAVQKETADEKKRDFRDRVRTYLPAVITIGGAIITSVGSIWGNFGASIVGVIAIIVGAVASIVGSWHQKSKD